jgi:hypothetical protein
VTFYDLIGIIICFFCSGYLPNLFIMHSPVPPPSVVTPATAHRSAPAGGQSTPTLLARLELMERGVKYLFCSAAGLSLVAYGCMVYTQEQWKIHHRQLLKLQIQESEQAIINARLRNKQAQNAEKSHSGLVAPQPDRALYVPDNHQIVSAPAPVPIDQPVVLPGPVGY